MVLFITSNYLFYIGFLSSSMLFFTIYLILSGLNGFIVGLSRLTVTKISGVIIVQLFNIDVILSLFLYFIFFNFILFYFWFKLTRVIDYWSFILSSFLCFILLITFIASIHYITLVIIASPTPSKPLYQLIRNVKVSVLLKTRRNSLNAFFIIVNS